MNPEELKKEVLKNPEIRAQIYSNMEHEIEQLKQEKQELLFLLGVKHYKYSFWDYIPNVIEHNAVLQEEMKKAGWVKQ